MNLNPGIKKQNFIAYVINFLQEDLLNSNMNSEKKESVEVAIQCLETAYEIDMDIKTKTEIDKVDLLSLFPPTNKGELTEEQIDKAEGFKNDGNSHMKNSEYEQAIVEYTKAIRMNPYNPVYYCNRAAAYSRLEKHLDAISDCKKAIELDPCYGKAYGRLGIAYSNLNNYEDACKSYAQALKYDPNNPMYETNLKLAQEKMFASMGILLLLSIDNLYKKFSVAESAAPPEHRPLDISQFINNPNLINMATQMLSDTNFRSLMSRFMTTNQSGDSNLDALIQAGQTLANRMQSADPDFVENLRRSLDPQNFGAASQSDDVNNDHASNSEKKSE
ncbi:small glutamine-rich tetratricopeptide repeat-containing protein beta-like isoform X1 [Diorhabda carinulata]|uniref:small glutamine-rich tetratricopeptide repeat-containing protein beta-like isoform X1 n=1 Tax=Diorhabda carinulata TaxID=1163345 RepID=UPI0025A031D2|nr:small glutamine-rich tetratricopeptide repeat-containing protein beta-like isoform X1 [Diorhabda carinulata]